MILQTSNPDEMHFHEQADTFDLTVTLSNYKLTFHLKDYVDWTIYSRQYTEDDYYKEIAHKMDLYDIYSAFSRTKT